MSFFLGIPALIAAGILQIVTQSENIATHGVGWLPTIVATVVSFAVAYLSIAWLLKFVSSHNFGAFVNYRIVLGIVIIALITSGVLTSV